MLKPNDTFFKSDDTVAREILRQLGGNIFCNMLGVKQMTYSDRGLTLKIPSRVGNQPWAKNTANTIRITLDVTDTYVVEFIRQRGTSVKRVSVHYQIYDDMLRGLIESETGLRTSLTAIYG